MSAAESIPDERNDARNRAAMDLKQLKETIASAGIEVYRTRAPEIHIAERVRFHIMDSGIRAIVEPEPRVSFTARSQRSDYSIATTENEFFERVRKTVGVAALARGYGETWSGATTVTDPMDDQRVLDVWFEVTYSKPIADEGELLDELRWALGLERYVAPAP